MFYNSLIGMDIGSSTIKVVLGKLQKNSVVVEKAFTVNTPPDLINDGNIKDIPKLAFQCDKALEENNIKSKKIGFTVNSSSIITREIVVPSVKEEEMYSLIKYEIEQYLPIVLSEYDIEYRLQKEFMEDNIKKSRVFVAVAPKSLVKGYMELAKHMKLTPEVLDINSNALSKIINFNSCINDMEFNKDTTAALIDIGCNNINVNILSNGVLRFNRLIDRGSKEIDTIIANSFGIPLSEAEEKKIKNCNLYSQEGQTTSIEMLNGVIRSIINSWLEDFQRIFQYYSTRSIGNKIDKIYLCGSGSGLSGLCKYISNSLNIETETIKSMNNVKLHINLKDLDIKSYLNAIGLLIRK